METSISVEKRNDMFAEEIVKHVLLKNFGIFWDPNLKEINPPKLPLKDFCPACVVLGEAVTTGWQKFYAAVEHESSRIHKNFKSSATMEEICESLKEVSSNIDIRKEFTLYVVLAIFGDFCVRICKSGAEHLISTIASGAKKYIVDEGFANSTEVQRYSVEFMEFCEN